MPPDPPASTDTQDLAELRREAVDQLHHGDDRRDAAEMRLEELVRDPEFDGDEDHHRDDSRASPMLWIGIGLTAAGVIFAWVWLRSLCC